MPPVTVRMWLLAGCVRSGYVGWRQSMHKVYAHCTLTLQKMRGQVSHVRLVRQCAIIRTLNSPTRFMTRSRRVIRPACEAKTSARVRDEYPVDSFWRIWFWTQDRSSDISAVVMMFIATCAAAHSQAGISILFRHAWPIRESPPSGRCARHCAMQRQLLCKRPQIC